MSQSARVGWAMAAISLAAVAASAQNHAPNPYLTIDGWAQMPEGRAWGATSAVYPARDGSGNMWVAERCGQNSCVGKEQLDTVFLFDPSARKELRGGHDRLAPRHPRGCGKQRVGY